MVLYKDFQPWEKPRVRYCQLTAKPWLFSIQGRLSESFRLMAAKTLKICIAYRQWRSTFLEGEENQNTKRKIKSSVFSGFGNGISRDWERKATTERFATGRFWPFTRKISSVGKDQVNNWEFYILEITPIVCFCSVSIHFLSWALAPTHFTIFIWGLSTLLFSFIN